MDWTPMIGRYRPIEQDALRVLTVVHQMGADSGERSSTASRRFIDTESQLQHLDHLIRHPIDLTYVLLDQVRSRGTELEDRLDDLAGRVRQLLGAPRRGRHRRNLLRPFDPGSWQRLDDVLALLGCRGLLDIETLSALVGPSGTSPVGTSPAENHGHEDRCELRYRVTSKGAQWLEDSVYPRSSRRPAIEIWRERCALLRDVLPADLLRPRIPTLAPYLQDTSQRLETYCHDEQIWPEDDLLGRLFRSTFAEEL